jgi:hypothetical protein
MNQALLRTIFAIPICLALAGKALGLGFGVHTYHNDGARTGAYTNETILTPTSVNGTDFGVKFAQPVDGYIYAQPLYLPARSIPGKGIHNVVYVATEHNSVYAFDADDNDSSNSNPLWVRHLTDPQRKTSAVSFDDLGYSDPPAHEFGITGTPVIDPVSGTLYAVAWVSDTSGPVQHFYHQLYALNVDSGEDRNGSPVTLGASIAASGPGSDDNGILSFNSYYHLQRAGLLLANGFIYISFASVGDSGPYHGWVLGYDAVTLALSSVFNDTPDELQGGIWMSGAAPAVDTDGSILLATGNGTFDATSGGRDYGDSILKLKPSPGNLEVVDYFTPFNQESLNYGDGDLGSGGVVLLPDSAGNSTHRRLLAVSGKEGILYLIDRDNLGKINSTDNSQIVQSVGPFEPIYSCPAYFNQRLYSCGEDGPLRAFSLGGGSISTNSVGQSLQTFGFPGGSPAVSASGTSNGIVWLIRASGFSKGASAVLFAYDASDVSRMLYRSDAQGNRDLLGLAQKFAVPTIADGKVFVGTGSGLSVFGLLNHSPTNQPLLQIEPNRTLVLTGNPGETYIIQSTEALLPPRPWQTLTTVTVSNSPIRIFDSLQPAPSTRVYRAMVGF